MVSGPCSFVQQTRTKTFYSCYTIDYDELVAALYKIWLHIETKHTESEGLGKFLKYFEETSKYHSKTNSEKKLEIAHISVMTIDRILSNGPTIVLRMN